MKFRFKSAIPAIGISLSIFALTACTMNGNNTTPNRVGTSPQGQNLNTYVTPGAQGQDFGSFPTPAVPGRNIGTDTAPNNQTPRNLSPAEINQRENVGGILGGTPGVPYPTPSRPLDQMYDRDKATNIERQLGTLTGVKGVDVIVVGNTAIVGYSADNRNVPQDTVARKVKQIDGSIQKVVFTNTGDNNTRLRRINADIRNNRGGAQTDNDLRQFMRDLIPGGR
ncbi:MAG: YhcN/YlaJ family sporulation lipoprotein [Clostridia bacterium]|nr:YhcN/YlaJ family sporulation lipoprotein [Clostridia bacterium]